MKKVLIDQNILWVAKDEALLKDYEFPPYEVGKDVRQTSYDENCGSFCYHHDCDFITADDRAYKHFFKNKMIKSVKILEFYFDKNSQMQYYVVRILEKVEKGIPADSNDGLTEDESLDAFNKIKSGEASRMGQKSSS